MVSNFSWSFKTTLNCMKINENISKQNNLSWWWGLQRCHPGAPGLSAALHSLMEGSWVPSLASRIVCLCKCSAAVGSLVWALCKMGLLLLSFLYCLERASIVGIMNIGAEICPDVLQGHISDHILKSAFVYMHLSYMFFLPYSEGTLNFWTCWNFRLLIFPLIYIMTFTFFQILLL